MAAPAPGVFSLILAHDKQKATEFRSAYRAFVADFRAGVASLIAQAKEITKLFPDWAFPPALHFTTPVPAASAPAAA